MPRPPKTRGAPPTALAERLNDIARRRGFGPDAVQALWDALTLGRGRMAQFSHAEFGGNGQWMRGGMVMVGDMFDSALSTKVGALADDLAQLHDDHPEFAAAALAEGHNGGCVGAGAEWWPAGLHNPATSGAQNGVRYAWFPIQQRLAIKRAGAVELYDTQDHLIGGVSQQQGRQRTLSFSSQHGPLALATLRRVTADPPPEAQADADALFQPPKAPEAPEPPTPAATTITAAASPSAPQVLLDTIGKLAELHQRGVLTDDEFKSKKAELLARL